MSILTNQSDDFKGFKAQFDHLIYADRAKFNGLLAMCYFAFPRYHSISYAANLILSTDEHDKENLIRYRECYLDLVFKELHNIPNFDRIIKDMLERV